MSGRTSKKLEQWMGRPNERNIIKYLIINPNASRTEISKALSISMSTVTNVTEGLIKKGLIVEDGLQKAQRGRSSIQLKVNNERFKSIGIGISSTLISVELVDLDGKKYAQHSLEHHHAGWKETFNNVSLAIKRILEDHKSVTQDIIGIGLATPGFVEYNRLNLDIDLIQDDWDMAEIALFLEDKFEYGVNISSAASSALSGESYFGAANSFKHILYLNISSAGIGWARMQGKVIDKHAAKYARAFGHNVVHLNGLKCTCGQHGCLELYTCKDALVSNYKKLASLEEDAPLLTNLDDSSRITYRMVLEYAEKGDYIAIQAVSKAATILGLKIADIVSLLHPDLIILAGRIVDQSRLYFDIAKKTANDKLRSMLGKEFLFDSPKVKTTFKFLEREVIYHSLAVGAASLVFENIFSEDNDEKTEHIIYSNG